MTHAQEMGQGERALTRAAGLVADAKADFDALSKGLEQQILAQQGAWVGAGGSAFFTLHQAWTDKQRTITDALDAFEASLTSTERDFMSTDDTQSSTYHRVAGRLG
ncbi:WXG100 family type VII secretion target [Nocardioides sp.]|uniref:WXG100 family type VII secretion target n=1 Tax=Nocardioides sp. TaxID=35761 RepID=UPI002ED9D357